MSWDDMDGADIILGLGTVMMISIFVSAMFTTLLFVQHLMDSTYMDRIFATFCIGTIVVFIPLAILAIKVWNDMIHEPEKPE